MVLLMPNKPRDGTGVKTYRVDLKLYAAVREKAASEGRTAGDVIREAFTKYVNWKPPAS